MYKPILLFLLITSAVISAESSPQLLHRQIVRQLQCSSQGLKDCGSGCIDRSDTCCPDRTGGCPTGTYCSLGSNGEYGCCKDGKICTGPGGVIPTPGTTIISTQTISGGAIPTPGTTIISTRTILPCSSQGLKDCGAGCIDRSDTCCPDRTGGCPAGTYCSLGSNEEYGCCQDGETCAGPGGAIPTLTLEPTDTSVSVSTYSPPSVSHSSTSPTNLITTNPTATTSLPGSIGAADSNIQGFLPAKLLAFVLPFFII
jgi:hypothetical protein